MAPKIKHRAAAVSMPTIWLLLQMKFGFWTNFSEKSQKSLRLIGQFCHIQQRCYFAGRLSLKWLVMRDSLSWRWLTAVWDRTSDWLFTNLSTNQRLRDKLASETRSTSSASSNFIQPPSKPLYEAFDSNYNQIGRPWCQSIGNWGQETRFLHPF